MIINAKWFIQTVLKLNFSCNVDPIFFFFFEKIISNFLFYFGAINVCCLNYQEMDLRGCCSLISM